jgi:hypothetical protein
VGVCVELLDRWGSPVRLPEVQGGFFNAAGDFDDLLSLTESMTLPVLSQVDPYGTVVFGR